jgi:hypothetical protein
VGIQICCSVLGFSSDSLELELEESSSLLEHRHNRMSLKTPYTFLLSKKQTKNKNKNKKKKQKKKTYETKQNKKRKEEAVRVDTKPPDSIKMAITNPGPTILAKPYGYCYYFLLSFHFTQQHNLPCHNSLPKN